MVAMVDIQIVKTVHSFFHILDSAANAALRGRARGQNLMMIE
jgi:hypothetical protein